MLNCKDKRISICHLCKYYNYCNVAYKCNGNCNECNILTCENNPKYKEYYTDHFHIIMYLHRYIEFLVHDLKKEKLDVETRKEFENDKQEAIQIKIRLEIELTNFYNIESSKGLSILI